MTGAQDQQSFPMFFFSYAHAHWEDYSEQEDSDLWVRKFYGDLCGEIERLVDLPRGQDPLFLDRRSALGSSWPLVLAERLSRCSVFVPLYTRNYFRNPDCGREWSIIRMRQNIQTAAATSYPNIVVPVLWDPVRPQDMPPWARDIQYSDEELGKAYRTYGLEELIRVRDHAAEYRRVVHYLARRIIAVATAPEQLRPLREIPAFRNLRDEFAELKSPGAEAGKVRITVAALDTRSKLPPGRSSEWYGNSALDWAPYRDPVGGSGHDAPAVWRASDVVRQSDYVTEITELTSQSEELKSNIAPTAPTILLVDPWATLDSSRWTILDRLDRITQNKPWIRIIVPWNTLDPETKENANVLHGGIESRLGHARSMGRIPSRRGEPGPVDSEAFGIAVSEAMRIALSEFLRQSVKYLPTGPFRGKPRLSGPVGMGAPFGADTQLEREYPEDRAAPKDSSSAGILYFAGDDPSPVRRAKTNRDLLPIRLYLSDAGARDAVERALKEAVAEFGITYVREFPGVFGSWWHEFRGDVQPGGSQPQKLSELEQALEKQLHQAKLASAQADAVSKLIVSLNETPQAVVQIGSVLLVKVDETILVRNLSERALEYYESNPALFRDPISALIYLQSAVSDDGPSTGIVKGDPDGMRQVLCECGSSLPRYRCRHDAGGQRISAM